MLFLFAAGLLGGCQEYKPDEQAPEPVEPKVQEVDPATEDLVLEPQWLKGDRWVWSDGYGLKVDSSGPDGTVFKRIDDDKQWLKRRGLTVIESQSARTHRKLLYKTGDPADIFPLKIGNTAVYEREYSSNGVLRVHRTSWVVEGRETIEVPAGTFDTWRLVRRSRSTLTGWTGYERWWYSPDVRNYVRMEFRYGGAPASSRVLMAYTLAPRVQLNTESPR
ncbi:MAG: hypothetical protein ACPGU7_01900 [Gammaproteobacteria bacterium]